jgi:predicted short-subunit dehydrogenase-like oxidoreductase (DUF2520 family)
MNKPTISIIGLGKVGMALIKVLSHNDYRIVSAVYKGSVPNALKTEYSDISFFGSIPDKANDLGDLILITVPDDAITDVVEDLDRNFSILNGKAVAHCSGTHASEILNALKAKGAKTASFHPNRSITDSTSDFTNTWFDVEGDEKLIQLFRKIADDLGAKLIEIEAEQTSYLHASAVIASNYLVVLADLMTRVSDKGGIAEDQSLKALIPLMRNTLDNIEQKGVTDSLTGPIARGDVNTVSGHLKLLSDEPDLKNLYKTLGREALRISKLENTDSSSFHRLNELLSDRSTE